MAPGQGWGPAGGGGFLRILGIVYLIKQIRHRRQERREHAEPDGTQDANRETGGTPSR